MQTIKNSLTADKLLTELLKEITSLVDNFKKKLEVVDHGPKIISKQARFVYVPNKVEETKATARLDGCSSVKFVRR